MKCCGDTPSPLIVTEKPDTTGCKANVGNLKVFNSYLMNKLQDLKMNNTIDFTNTKITKTLGSAAVRITGVIFGMRLIQWIAVLH